MVKIYIVSEGFMPIGLDMRMLYVSVSYNLQWGRQKRGANKIINADAAIEKSTAGGR